MTPEQTLIQQISQMIENGMLERNALLDEYAVQYADLCGSVNARLLQCANYLEKGLLSEAMYIARQSPDLLETVQMVQFPLARKWQNICMDLELTVPPLLHTEIVERLQKASDQENAISPLLQEFRKCTYQRNHRGALEVLRKIRGFDPENQSWKENLRLLEEEELPRWLERLEAALEKNDLEELKIIEKELCHPCRVAPVPEECLKKLARSLQQEHRDELLREAEDLMDNMRRNLELSSAAGVRKLLDQSRELEKNDAFLSRPEHWTRMQEEAEEFLTAEAGRQKQLARHQEEEQEFQKMLESGRATDLELRQALQRLEKDSVPVSGLLKQQVEEVIAERRRLRMLKLKSSFGIILVVLVLVLGTGAAWFYMGHRSRVLRGRMVQIETLIQQKDFSGAEKCMAAFKADYPDMLQDPGTLELNAALEKGLADISENRRLTEALWSEMLRAQQGGFNISDSQAAAWLDRSQLLKWTPEEKISLKNWQSAWLREKKTRQQESNAQVRQAVQKSVNFMEYHRGDLPGPELLRQIEELQEELRLVRSQALYVEEGLKLALEQRLDALNAWKTGLQKKMAADTAEAESRQQRQAELEARRKKLVSFIQPEDLTAYFSSLEHLVKLGGQDLTMEFGRILSRREQQNSTFILNEFSYLQLPLNSQTAERLEKILSSRGRNTVWDSELNLVLRDWRNNREAVDALAGTLLEQQEQYRLYRLMYRKKGTEDWRPLYMPALLNHREETIRTVSGPRSARKEEVQKYTLYWGQIYYWEKEEDEPLLMHTSKVFSNGLNTLEYDVEKISPRKDDHLCPHGRFLIQLVADSAEVRDPGIFLLQKVKEVEENQSFEPVPRFWLKKRLILYLSERIYPGNSDLKKLARKYERIDTRVPWMNRRHPATRAAEQQIRAAGSLLPDIGDIQRKLALQRAVSARSLAVAPRCIGVLLPDREGTLKLSPAAAAGQELRVLVPAAAAGGEVWMQLSENGVSLNPEILRQCVPGQPVFAVRESCQQWLEKHVTVSDEEWQALRRPGCWPENAWSKPEVR